MSSGAFRLRRSGRSSPDTPASLPELGNGTPSRANSGFSSLTSGLSSIFTPAGSPPGSSGGRSPVAGRPGGPGFRALLLAMLPAAVLLGTLTSMHHNHQARSQLADELLATAYGGEAPPGTPRGARQLGEAQSYEDGRACADALQIPQVAMLFLVKGPLRHEAMWRQWFQRAEGLLPARAVSNALCATEEGMPDTLVACSSIGARQAAAQAAGQEVPEAQTAAGGADGGSGGGSTGSGSRGTGGRGAWRQWLADHWPGSSRRPSSDVPFFLDRQHLFDVYVHPHPNFTGYAPGSLLFGRELPPSQRVETQWGSHSLVDAAESLLAAALKNPRNQKFFMVSESDLPLYSPHVMYLQLMNEHRSRLNACNSTAGWDLDFYRWVDRMQTPFLTKELWRKSSQWFVLNRKHAELVLADRQVERVFQEHCKTMYEEERKGERVCYPDEHYIPTLLAVHGLDNETDCQGWFMDVDWSRVSNTSPHPWEYTHGEMRDQLFDALRRPQRPGCSNAAGALAAAPGAFLQQDSLFAAARAASAAASNVPELEQLGRGVCRELLLHQQQEPNYPGIGPECPLVARKFPDLTVKPALMAMAPCDSTSLILNDGRCPGESERRRYWRQQWWRIAPWLVGCSCMLLSAMAANALFPLRTLPQVFAHIVSAPDARLTAPWLDV